MTPSISIDATFLDRLRRREPQALAEAVHEHARPLHRAARAMGFSAQEAEDLVQDVFTTFLERLEQFEGRSALRTWLFGILHRKSMERRRAAAIDDRSDPIDALFDSRFDAADHWSRPPADLQRLFESQEIGEAIRDCLSRLAAHQRDAFVLREVSGVPTDEICKILGVTGTHIGVLMFRARARLRECLESKGWNKP